MSDDPTVPQTKHDPDCIPSTWITEPIATEPAGLPECKRITGQFELRTAAVFPTVSGGELQVGPGTVSASFWISRVDPRDDESDDLIVETWLADDQGQGWRCRSYGSAYMLVVSKRAEPFQLWESAPASWKEAMAENCLLRDLRVLLGRELYELRLSSADSETEKTYIICEKHQAPTVDLALVESTGVAIVRVSQINHEVVRHDWRTNPAPAVDIGMLPAYAYELSVVNVVPTSRVRTLRRAI